MIFVNDMYKAKVYIPYFIRLIKLLYQLRPSWRRTLFKFVDVATITYEAWPTYSAAKLVVNEVTCCSS